MKELKKYVLLTFFLIILILSVRFFIFKNKFYSVPKNSFEYLNLTIKDKKVLDFLYEYFQGKSELDVLERLQPTVNNMSFHLKLKINKILKNQCDNIKYYHDKQELCLYLWYILNNNTKYCYSIQNNETRRWCIFLQTYYINGTLTEKNCSFIKYPYYNYNCKIIFWEYNKRNNKTLIKNYIIKN